ncbi:hypothetical protein C8D87_109288, partial [Lentzea atacamensis]
MCVKVSCAPSLSCRCWQLGADWGEVDESDALALLHAAADTGVGFF